MPSIQHPCRSPAVQEREQGGAYVRYGGPFPAFSGRPHGEVAYVEGGAWPRFGQAAGTSACLWHEG